MATLHIALQDGFRDDAVTIAVDGRVVYNRAGVSSDLRIARADAVDVEVASARARVVVSVEPGHLRASVELDPVATPHLAVELQRPGTIRLTPSQTEPRYM